MELPDCDEKNRYFLNINNRSSIYNFKTSGRNFDLKTTIFSYLETEYPLIVQKNVINEKLIKENECEIDKKKIMLQ